MTLKRTSFLLATSAIVGITATSPAFAQIEDQANPGVALTTTPIVNATDGGKDLALTSTTEEIQFTEATVGLGDSVTMDGQAAIEAEDSSAATTLGLNNTGAATTIAVTIDSGDAGASIQKEATQNLNVNIRSAVGQAFSVTATGDVNLGGGVLSVLSGASSGNVSATIMGNTTAGAIQTDSTNANANITFQGNVTAPVLAILHDEGANTEIVTFSGNNALAVSSDIVADSAGNMAGGDIVVSGTGTVATFNGNIGSTTAANITAAPGIDSAHNIATLNVQSGNTATLTQTSAFSGNVTAGGILNNSGTLTVGGDLTGAGTISNTGTATVNGALTATGMVTNSGTLSVTGATSGASTIANSGTLNLNGANAATVNNAGTLNIGAPITNTGTIDFASSGTTTVGLNAITNGQTAIAGGATNLTGNATVLLNPNLVMGNTVTIADMTAATTNGNLAANVANLTVMSALNQVTVDTMTGAVIATIGAANTVAQTASALGVSTPEASKLLSAGTDAAAGNFASANAAFTSFQTEILNALTGTTAEARAIAERLGDATAAAGATTDAAAATFKATNSNIAKRLASLRTDETGVAAGNGAATENMWFEATASTLDQDRRKGVAGFEVESAGGTIGYDAEAGNGHVGVAFGYNYSQIDGDSAANVDNQINTYLLTLYGGQEIGNSFVNGSVHFGINDVDTTQTSDVRRSGNYTNEQYGAAIDIGHKINISKNTRLVPAVGLNYTRIGSDSVTLQDINGVNPDITDSISSRELLIGKVGARLENDHHTNAGGLVRTALHANFLYDFASDEVTSIRNFGGGVTVQDEQAQVAEEAVNVGAALTYESANRKTAVQFGYDLDLKDEFIGHTGSVRFSFRF